MKRAFFVLTLACLLAPGRAYAATIFFDDFDTENGGVGALNYNSFANFTVTDGTVDLIPLANGQFDLLPGNGLYVDLDGSSSDAGVQTANPIPLGPGSYILSFDLAGSQLVESPFDSVDVSVFGDQGSYLNLFFIGLPHTLSFTTFSFGFTVTTADNIRFSFSNGGGDNRGTLLDRVRLESVPEPGTLVLLGLGALASAARRRRSAASA